MRRAVASAIFLASALVAAADEPPRIVDPGVATVSEPPDHPVLVLVAVDLDDSGRVTSATVLSGETGRYADAALAAARRLRFSSGAGSITLGYSFAPGTVEATPDVVAVGKMESVTVRKAVRALHHSPQPVQMTLTGSEARRAPGTMGDPGKVVESLPGVARASVGTANLSVWGAAPEQTRTLIDGIEVPSLYH